MVLYLAGPGRQGTKSTTETLSAQPRTAAPSYTPQVGRDDGAEASRFSRMRDDDYGNELLAVSGPFVENESLKDAKKRAQGVDRVARTVGEEIHTLEELLTALGMQEKIGAFQEAEIDLESLPTVTDAELKTVGLNMGERIKLLRVVDLKRGTASKLWTK